MKAAGIHIEYGPADEPWGRPPLLRARSLGQARQHFCPSRRAVKLATFNVNGVNGRLSVLLRWLPEAKPDVVCLQELRGPPERVPHAAILEAG